MSNHEGYGDDIIPRGRVDQGAWVLAIPNLEQTTVQLLLAVDYETAHASAAEGYGMRHRSRSLAEALRAV